jgi:hypothetical protein
MMSRTHAAAVVVALTPALLAFPPSRALGQALEGIEFEGPITAATANSITVMGIVVAVRGGTLSTPTNPAVPLTALAAPLPGRPQGFIGGTAIVEGTSTAGQVTANPAPGSVFSDVSENVVVGEATDPDGNPATQHVNGLELRRSIDPRIPGAPPHDGFGFEIRPETITAGTLLSAEGYWSETDAALHWHDLESDAAQLVRPGQHEVSVLRARCRKEGEELEIRGGAHLPLPATATAIGRVRVTALDQGGATVAGPFTVPVTPVVDPAGFGRWRLSADDLTFTACPAAVLAQLLPPLAGENVLASAQKELEER